MLHVLHAWSTRFGTYRLIKIWERPLLCLGLHRQGVRSWSCFDSVLDPLCETSIDSLLRRTDALCTFWVILQRVVYPFTTHFCVCQSWLGHSVSSDVVALLAPL